jgi:long-chain fatty acid transport protein
MKTTNRVLATAIATLLIAPAAFATNGTNMTGISAPSAALGGTGTAAYFGPSNVITNPALIGKSEGTIFGFGGTLFKPSVSNDGLMGDGTNKASSAADTFMIPSVSLTSRINDNMTFGIGMYGTSGMGVDYKNATGANGMLLNAQSTLQIMRIVPTIAYNKDNFGIGFSPIIQYGALDINYNNAMAPNAPAVGSGMSSDLGYGFTLGGFYDVTKQLTLGAAYTSAIDMKYKNQLSTASAPFVGLIPTAFGDNLAQPAEIKVGAAYTMGNIMVTGDLKQIRWSEATGYKEFGWQDQNVIALGLKYSGNGYWLGVGFNKADNPIKAQDANLATGGTTAGAVTNMFNNMFFPATTESHFSFGGGYNLTKAVTLNGAVVYAPEVTTTVDTSGITQAMAMGQGAPMNMAMGATSSNTTSHSQLGYTVSVQYKF